MPARNQIISNLPSIKNGNLESNSLWKVREAVSCLLLIFIIFHENVSYFGLLYFFLILKKNENYKRKHNSLTDTVVVLEWFLWIVHYRFRQKTRTFFHSIWYIVGFADEEVRQSTAKLNWWCRWFKYRLSWIGCAETANLRYNQCSRRHRYFREKIQE